jgi:protein SCO1/2
MAHRIALTAGAAAVALAVLAAAWLPTMLRQPGEAAGFGIAEVGGPFRLVDTAGRPVTDQDLLGRPTVIFFGFTFCPEVCPTTLHELSGLMKELGPDADRLNVVFVSVDPERDTPDQLRDYLSLFDPRIRGLTGTQEQVERIAAAYRVYHRRVPLEGGSYTMDHTASVYLMDPEGRFTGTIAHGEAHDTALAKLARLAGMAAPAESGRPASAAPEAL